MNFSDNILQQVEDYLDGKMDDSTQKLFEEKILEDIDLLELITLNKQMRSSYNEKDWYSIDKPNKEGDIGKLADYFKSDDAKTTKSAIQKASKKYFKQKKTNYYSFIAIAASILLLIGYFLMDKQITNDELYLQYNNWSEIPSLTSRSDFENEFLIKGEEAFLNKNYIKAEQNFHQFFLNEEIVNTTGLIYLGVSQLELNKFNESLLTFDKLIKSNTIDKSKGYWYKVLVYLKMNDREKAINQLNVITQNTSNYNYKEALKILSKIEK